jgi:hypothetical protein
VDNATSTTAAGDAGESAVPDSESRETRDLAGLVCVILAVFAAASLAIVFWWSSGRGFDLTDEGFHLNTLRHANDAPQGGSQFGNVVRMITLGRTLSVSGYRLLGYALLEASAAAAAFAFVRYCKDRLPAVADELPPKAAVVATAMVGATLGYSWLPRTISYLVLTPALLCVIGALCLWMISGPERSFKLRAADVVVAMVWGAAGSLLFYTKFSSSAAGMTITVVAIAIAVGWRRAVSITAVGVATFVVVTVVLNASGAFSVNQLFHSASALGGGSHSPSSLQNAYVDELKSLFTPTIEGAIFLGLVLTAPLLAVRLRRPLGFAAAAICTVVGAAGFVRTLGSSRFPWQLSPIMVFAVVGAIAFAMVVGWFLRRRGDPRSGDGVEFADEPRVQRRDVPAWIALVLVVLGLPFAGSIGTNTGLLSMALSTGALLALVFVMLFAEWRAALPKPVRQNVFVAVPLAVALACFGFVVVRSVGRDLYRVPFPASKQTEQLHGVRPIRELRLDSATRRMIEQVVTAASRGPGVKPGSPILTSTNLEGLAYVLDGYVPGAGWIDPSETTCSRLASVRAELARTDLLIVAKPLGKRLDACFRRTVPGYPDAFRELGTVDLDPAWQRELVVTQVAVLRRQ